MSYCVPNVSIDLDARECEKRQFNLIRDVRDGLHHIVKSENDAVIRQNLGLRCVNCLGLIATAHRQTFDASELTLPAFVLESDPSFPHLIKGKHHPRQQFNCLTDERQVASEGIARCKVRFPSA